ncbi:MAG: hypothetical protein ACFFCQ_13510 [Promethearchaeota archaeon]
MVRTGYAIHYLTLGLSTVWFYFIIFSFYNQESQGRVPISRIIVLGYTFFLWLFSPAAVSSFYNSYWSKNRLTGLNMSLRGNFVILIIIIPIVAMFFMQSVIDRGRDPVYLAMFPALLIVTIVYFAWVIALPTGIAAYTFGYLGEKFGLRRRKKSLYSVLF